MMLVRTCKRRLAGLWFGSSALLFALIFAQTVGGRYGDDAEAAWNWLLPALVPTLSLIIGVLVADARAAAAAGERIDAFAFWLAFGVSGAYLAALAAALLAQPLSSLQPLELLKSLAGWLSAFQGLATAALGAFFVRKRE